MKIFRFIVVFENNKKFLVGTISEAFKLVDHIKSSGRYENFAFRLENNPKNFLGVD